MGPSEKIYKTQAIVLRHYPFGETDYVLSLFTPNKGKVRAVVKGARRVKSKLGGHVEPLMRTSFLLVRGQNLDSVNQAECLESFRSIREDLGKLSRALYIMELVDVVTNEGQSNYDLYNLVLDTLNQLAVDNSPVLLPYFQIRLLSATGFKPELYSCVDCASSISPGYHRFCPEKGGVLCNECNPLNAKTLPLSIDSLKVLRFFQKENYNRISGLNLTNFVRTEIQTSLEFFLKFTLDKEIKSSKFLDQVEYYNRDNLIGTVVKE